MQKAFFYFLTIPVLLLLAVGSMLIPAPFFMRVFLALFFFLCAVSTAFSVGRHSKTIEEDIKKRAEKEVKKNLLGE